MWLRFRAVANPTPQQVRRRGRFESAISLVSPVLDLVLAAGDRLSRAVGHEDEYYPVRPPGEEFELVPAARRGELPPSDSPDERDAA
ncbi:hypothetical protein BH24ACT23_BH24ACT23_11950 [soil metagenome]